MDPQADVLSSIIIDSTINHGKHFFDLNCKICTGKQPEKEVGPPAKKAKVSFVAEDEKSETPAKSETVDTDTAKSGDDSRSRPSYGPDQDFVNHDPFCLGGTQAKTDAVTASPSHSATGTAPVQTPDTMSVSAATTTTAVHTEPVVTTTHSRKPQPNKLVHYQDAFITFAF